MMGTSFTKKSILLFLLLTFLSTNITGSKEKIDLEIKVKVNEAKVRYKASASSSIVAVVRNGDTFGVENKEGEWYLIILPLRESMFRISGYIHQNDVEIIDEVMPEEKEEKEKDKINQETASEEKISEEVALNKAPKKEVVKESSKKNDEEKIILTSSTYARIGKIIYTTSDLKCDYEIIDILCHYQEFSTFSLRDPLEGAIKKGMKMFEKKVEKIGGDAVVGLRFEFANRTQKDEGRLLIYGTVVKLK